MSPTSTARHRSTTPRKVALCAAAVLATLLPTACGAAYADSGHSGHGTEVVEVGGADAAEPAAVNAPDDDGDDDAEADAADGDEDAAEGDEEDADEKDADADGERRGNGGNGDNGKDNENKGKDNNGNGNDNNGNNNNGNNNNGNNNNGGDEDNNGLDVLGRDCSNSDLEPHNGFQEAPRCVDTAFGEVASEEKSPSLLITESPETVKAGEEFTITVSTRNLIRDRFLGAAAGGYYLESSFLNEDGIQRGHFHTACRMLESTSEAPDAEPEPEFFLATQDNEGGEGPDFVEITVSGMPTAGTAQCAVWAGDGSHRIPMMQRADQTPAFDAVRITVE